MSQKTDNMIKLALVFFVSLLSFSIGTYVGKKYSDNQHKLSLLEPKKETPAPKAEEFASDVSELDKARGPANPEVIAGEQKPAALTDSEVAKIAEEFAAEDVATEEKLVATIEPQEKELKTITDTMPAKPIVKSAVKPAVKPPVNNLQNPPQTTAVTQAAIQKIKQQEAHTEERIPASITSKVEVASLHFTVQVGAFPTKTEAEKMTKELQDKGYKTTFVPAKVNGQMWFRVNVGLFGTVKEAQDYKKEFLEKTKLSSAIVQRVLQ